MGGGIVRKKQNDIHFTKRPFNELESGSGERVASKTGKTHFENSETKLATGPRNPKEEDSLLDLRSPILRKTARTEKKSTARNEVTGKKSKGGLDCQTKEEKKGTGGQFFLQL